ncbi:Nitroreductase family [Pelomyxa schiedti]|nr:Nitroreductase family [Pelomyxa schiedti]
MASTGTPVEQVLGRRSVRSFDATRTLTSEVLDQLVAAAVNAPTAINQQHFRLLMETDAAVLKAVSKGTMEQVFGPGKMDAAAFKKMVSYPGDDLVFYDAPAVLFIFYPPTSVSAKAPAATAMDIGFVAQNVICVATLLGLGTVPIGMISRAGTVVNNILGVSSDQQLALAVAVGYPTPQGAIPAPLGVKKPLSALLAKV